MYSKESLHKILARFGQAIYDVLELSGFFDLPEGTYDPVDFYNSISKQDLKAYQAASQKKNFAAWEAVKDVFIASALLEMTKSASSEYSISAPTRTSLQDIAEDYYKENGLKFVKTLTKTDANKLKSFIWSNAMQGERPLKQALLQQPHLSYIADVGNRRLNLIETVEVGRAWNRGGQIFMGQAGFEVNTWFTMGDNRVRPSHKGNHGITVKIGDPFPNGEHYPGESSIGCRCHMSYGNDTPTRNAKTVYASNLKAYEEELAEQSRNNKIARGVAPDRPVGLTIKGSEPRLGEFISPRKVAPIKDKPYIKKLEREVKTAIAYDKLQNYQTVDLLGGGKLYAPATTAGKKAAEESLKNYNSLPTALKVDGLKLTILPEKYIADNAFSKAYGKEMVADAVAHYKTKEIVKHSQFGRPEVFEKDVLAHESAHLIDTKFSKSAGWRRAAESDIQHPTDYAKESLSAKGNYREDFAESIKLYVAGDKNFRINCPARAEYIEKNVLKETVPVRDLAEEMIAEFKRKAAK